jgi:alpha-N-acetylglucosamine transferase
MNAFVLIHFGNKTKYLELEIFFLRNLRKNTKNDIIYLYSINDTPEIFLDIIENYCDKIIPYDDNNITYNVVFSSAYVHFNTLRTCNFIFAYKLIEYSKVCVMESDIVILDNIDDIFSLNTPSILLLRANILENYKIEKDIENFENINVNGGTMLFDPSLEKYDMCIKKIKDVIEKEYKYPNESLYLLVNDYIYNLPYKYNGTQFQFKVVGNKYNINLKKYLKTVHFNSTEYKHIDIIRDNYLEFLKNKHKLLYYFVIKFKKEYYDIYYEKIHKIINEITED